MTVPWIACAVLAYLAVRLDAWFVSATWTVGDRWSAIVFALLTGPMATLVALVILCMDLLQKTDWNRPARW